jgi:hypothetical protein
MRNPVSNDGVFFFTGKLTLAGRLLTFSFGRSDLEGSKASPTHSSFWAASHIPKTSVLKEGAALAKVVSEIVSEAAEKNHCTL